MNFYVCNHVLKRDPNADTIHCLFGTDGSSLGNGSVINSFCMVEKDEDFDKVRDELKTKCLMENHKA